MKNNTCRNLALLSASTVLLICSACSNANKMADPNKKNNHPESIAVKINGTPIFWGEVDLRARGFLKDEQEMAHLAFAADKEHEALNYYRKRAIKVEVMRHLMLAEVKRLGIVIDEKDHQRALEKIAPLMAQRNWTTNDFFTRSPIGEAKTRLEFEESLYTEKLLAKVTANVTETTEEMEKEIQRQSALRQTRLEKIDSIREKIVAGANFAQMARHESQDPTSSKRGGSLGEVPRGRFGDKIDNVVFNLKPGELSEITSSPDGFHIFLVTAHNAPRAATETTPAIPETIALSHILIRHRNLKYPEVRQIVIRNERRKYADEYYRSLVAAAEIECVFPDLTFESLDVRR